MGEGNCEAKIASRQWGRQFLPRDIKLCRRALWVCGNDTLAVAMPDAVGSEKWPNLLLAPEIPKEFTYHYFKFSAYTLWINFSSDFEFI